MQSIFALLEQALLSSIIITTPQHLSSSQFSLQKILKWSSQDLGESLVQEGRDRTEAPNMVIAFVHFYAWTSLSICMMLRLPPSRRWYANRLGLSFIFPLRVFFLPVTAHFFFEEKAFAPGESLYPRASLTRYRVLFVNVVTKTSTFNEKYIS